MSPGPIMQTLGAAASVPSPQEQPPPVSQSPPVPHGFDEIFHDKFMRIIQDYKDRPRSTSLTQKDRKLLLDQAYHETEQIYWGNRQLSDFDLKMQAMTKVFFRILQEEPWTEDWIRPPDVERKLSRFEMHKDSVDLAQKHGFQTPRDAILAARLALIEANKKGPNDKPGLRGPFDDIEIIYIAGTVSSTATNKIDRDNIYPISVASVSHVLQMHMCRDVTKPYSMALKFVTCTDVEELMKIRQFGCDICDFAPHLLDNDNVSLLIVLLILTRSEICRRFENNGIRIEGSTISHRRAECLKTKLGWKNADERRQFDNVANDLQTRLKNACFPVPRGIRGPPRAKQVRKSTTPLTTPVAASPPLGYFPSPPLSQSMQAANGAIPRIYSKFPVPHQDGSPGHALAKMKSGNSAAEPMDLS
ncbi:hypothetical protein B0J11DRAFT_551719 [Dendryphion nanum]|uniref:Uncharacterized protein n=1 Tax=Dendryphion nanum TaxID=256645 RepID=A0A9P9IHY7_9PLEO|nr:hypothetical protein B0J11DRAFT_551719 [Dendryphion nanum]